MKKVAEEILSLIKTSKIKADFVDIEKVKLIDLYKENNLNQFYHLIIEKVLSKKSFSESKDELIPFLISILADKVGKTSIPCQTDNEIISYAELVYNSLFFLDIKEIYNNRF